MQRRVQLEVEYDFYLVGISCHLRDYRLASEINKALHCDFVRQEDHELYYSGGQKAYFPLFKWQEPNEHYTYYLVKNKGDLGLMAPEERLSDYFFMITGGYHQLDTNEIFNAIKKAKGVLAAYLINVDSMKSAESLLIEWNLLSIKRKL